MVALRANDLTSGAWTRSRPEEIASEDRDVTNALDDLQPLLAKGVEELIAADEVAAATKSAEKVLQVLRDAEKIAKKIKVKRDREVVESFLEPHVDFVESFVSDLERAVDEAGHPPEFLALRSRYDTALADDIARTTSGPKPYLLLFRDFAGKKDAFLTIVFRTGRVMPQKVTEITKDMRSVFGTSFEQAEGVVRKDGTRYVFEYPSSVTLPEKIRKQMKQELGLKVEFEQLPELSAVVMDGEEPTPPTDGVPTSPSTGGSTPTGPRRTPPSRPTGPPPTIDPPTSLTEALTALRTGAKVKPRGVQRLPPNPTEVQRATVGLVNDGIKASNECSFGIVDSILAASPPAVAPVLHVMEGSYPEDGTSELATEMAPTITVDRSLHRSGTDNPNHGITVGGLVANTFPGSSVSLAVALGDPAADHSGDFSSLSEPEQQRLSTAANNKTFQAYFDKLMADKVEGSIVNLSQMVRPYEELEPATVGKMVAVAATNVVVLALGNQGTKSDSTPAFKRLHDAIASLPTGGSGTIVLVENVKSYAKNGTATLVATSNYLTGPKPTTFALTGSSTEMTGDGSRSGRGDGTSYAAPKLSALIAKLVEAASIATGRRVTGREAVEALAATADHFTVKARSESTEAGVRLTTPEELDEQPLDTFTINVPNGDAALARLVG